jgi:broad specificity phosphatase PhoE
MTTSNNNNNNVVKTIYLIRHGVAAHNRPGVNTLDPEFTDSPLVEQGRVQARLVGKRLCQMGLIIHGDDDDDDNNDATMKDQSSNSQQLASSMNDSSVAISDGGGGPIDLIICSPLTRCMETAELIFPKYFANNNAAAVEQQGDDSDEHQQQRRCHDNNNRYSNLISTTTTTTTTSSTKEAGYHHHTNNNNYNVICHGDVREAYGIRYSDKHGPISILKMRYPPNNVIYYHQPSLSVNEDTQWQSNVRESWNDVEERVRRFFHWLILYLDQQQQKQQQKQQRTVAYTTNSIAIVTHGVWMECALLMYCPDVINFGDVRVHNCDVYEAKLVVVSTTAVAEGEAKVAADSSSTLENNQSGDKMMMVRLQDAKKLISIV